MTCEICGKNQMNVATYAIPDVTKLDACTQCIRGIDLITHNNKLKWVEQTRNEIQDLIDYRKTQIEELKRAKE